MKCKVKQVKGVIAKKPVLCKGVPVLFIKETEDKELYTKQDVGLLAECMFDITRQACALTAAERIKIEDSRELYENIFAWAKEFENNHNYDDTSDSYSEDIVLFAQKKLLDSYGNVSSIDVRSERKKACSVLESLPCIKVPSGFGIDGFRKEWCLYRINTKNELDALKLSMLDDEDGHTYDFQIGKMGFPLWVPVFRCGANGGYFLDDSIDITQDFKWLVFEFIYDFAESVYMKMNGGEKM